jgi:hypothetical protein
MRLWITGEKADVKKKQRKHGRPTTSLAAGGRRKSWSMDGLENTTSKRLAAPRKNSCTDIAPLGQGPHFVSSTVADASSATSADVSSGVATTSAVMAIRSVSFFDCDCATKLAAV